MSVSRRNRVLLSVTGFHPKRWYDLLSEKHEVVLEPAGDVDPSIEYAVVWKHPHGLFAKLPNLKVILSIGAGVDHIFTDPNLPDVPVVRIVSENLSQHMIEYVVWRVLDHHRQGMTYRSQQADRIWHELHQPDAHDISVGIMGLGELGRAVAKALLPLGFNVNGWSRNPKNMDGVNCFSGEQELTSFLNQTDILVVLLPHTPATEGIINHTLLSRLRRDNPLGGAVLINAGRGKLQNEADILRALDDGTLKETSLDVFETEPLPQDSPLWSHPRVFITPHAAAASDPAHLVPLMLAQIDRFERGDALQNLADKNAGY